MNDTRSVLDVRSVEPRHRFDTIMNAFRSLDAGSELELVVDHDPMCMYYTLKVEYGDEAFSFQHLEKGPENWRVCVGKKRA